MAEKNINTFPDYRKIYTDIINEKFPEKVKDIKIQEKINNIRSSMDVLELNKLIFRDIEKKTECKSQKLRSYDKDSVLKILNYQKKHKLTNSNVANHFKMSRNTVAKWRRIFDYDN